MTARPRSAHELVRLRSALPDQLRARGLAARGLVGAILEEAHRYADIRADVMGERGPGDRRETEMRTRRELCRALLGTDDLEAIAALCARGAA